MQTSDAILDEFRKIVQYPRIRRRFLKLTSRQVERFIKWIRTFAAVTNDVPAAFDFQRDPKDTHYLNLAIATQSSLIVTRDHDLLELMTGTDTEAVTFRTNWPGIAILDPVTFLRSFPEDTP